MSDFHELDRAFRITAFLDILGWGALTKGVPLLTMRRAVQGEPLEPDQSAQLGELQARVQTARRINDSIEATLNDLPALCRPFENVMGSGVGAGHFLKNAHVVYVRASDCIFAHSKSFQAMTVFVSELQKRCLSRGILLRNGPESDRIGPPSARSGDLENVASEDDRNARGLETRNP